MKHSNSHMPYAKLDASDARITRRTEFESKNHET